MKLFKVVFEAALLDKGGKGKGSEVTDGHLVRRGVFDNLCAQVGTFDRAQILLIRFAVTCVLKILC